jgi:predicted nucleic acid-binding protein
MAAERVFIDTNVLVATAVDVHPSHAAATAYVDRLAAEGATPCISPQICREFLVVLTRGPVEGRAFTVDEALLVLEKARQSWTVLSEDLDGVLDLVRKHEVKGKQVHDANIVATMLANGVRRLATLNIEDFKRFEDEIAIEALVS